MKKRTSRKRRLEIVLGVKRLQIQFDSGGNRLHILAVHTSLFLRPLDIPALLKSLVAFFHGKIAGAERLIETGWYESHLLFFRVVPAENWGDCCAIITAAHPPFHFKVQLVGFCPVADVIPRPVDIIGLLLTLDIFQERDGKGNSFRFSLLLIYPEYGYRRKIIGKGNHRNVGELESRVPAFVQVI